MEDDIEDLRGQIEHLEEQLEKFERLSTERLGETDCLRSRVSSLECQLSETRNQLSEATTTIRNLCKTITGNKDKASSSFSFESVLERLDNLESEVSSLESEIF